MRQLSDDQVKKLQRYENDLKKLHVTKKAQDSTPDSVVAGFKTMAMYHFNSKIQDLAYKSPVQIPVEESNEKRRRKKGVGFSIQDFFDKLYAASVNDGDNTRLVLFGDQPDSKEDYKKKGVDNKIEKLIVSTWEVTYKKEAEYVFNEGTMMITYSCINVYPVKIHSNADMLTLLSLKETGHRQGRRWAYSSVLDRSLQAVRHFVR